jgi:nucleoside-diphosphate-sugar epimerase
VVREAVDTGTVELTTTLDSARDFVHVDDVVAVLPLIAQRGRRRLYNVASGRHTSNAAIVEALRRETRCSVSVAAGAPHSAYPVVDISRLREDLGFEPSRDVVAAMPAIVAAHRRAPTNEGV